MAEDEGKSLENEERSKESLNQSKSNSQYLSAVKERSEYFDKLEKWLQEAYVCQSVAAMFPYYVMSTQILNPANGKNLPLSISINSSLSYRRFVFSCFFFAAAATAAASGINPFAQMPNGSFSTGSNTPQANVEPNIPDINEGLRQRRPQDQTGMAQPPGAEGRRS